MRNLFLFRPKVSRVGPCFLIYLPFSFCFIMEAVLGSRANVIVAASAAWWTTVFLVCKVFSLGCDPRGNSKLPSVLFCSSVTF